MPVIAFNFDKFHVERKKELETPIKADTGMKIIDVKEEDIALREGKQKVLRFFYNYNVEYKPDQAEIVIEGNLVYVEPEEELGKIMKEWEKTKKLPTEVMRSVMNNVLMRCQIKALTLSQDLGLPPHLRLPLIQSVPKEKAKAEYTG